MKSIVVYTLLFLTSVIFTFLIVNPQNSRPDIVASPSPVQVSFTTPPTSHPTPISATLPQNIHHQMPFTSQAPTAEWDNPLYQDGCEEAAIIIAMSWLTDRKTLETQYVKDQITAIADFQMRTFNTSADTSAADTAETLRRLLPQRNVTINTSPTVNSIRQSLAANRIIIAPTNGRLLGNPHFTPPGPERHMIVITGYDDITGEFITHDPGTRLGADYHYPYDTLLAAIADYPTGNHLPNHDPGTSIIIVDKD